jgi:hypothetical protein
MEAVSTSEMSVNFYPTIRRSIPEDSHIIFVRSMFHKNNDTEKQEGKWMTRNMWPKPHHRVQKYNKIIRICRHSLSFWNNFVCLSPSV